MRKQKGITLVALVVTIVVLLILAAVSINITFRENGLFQKAKDASDKTKNAVEYETNTLPQLMGNYIKDHVEQEGDSGDKTEEIYLVDKVEIGDYVAYDAGIWESTVDVPTTSAVIGGYTVSTNKGTSVNSYNGTNKAPTDGWRVLNKSGSGATGTVTLIHAGCPAQGYYGYTLDERIEMIAKLNDFANTNFVNSTYAMSARNAEYAEINSLDNALGGLRNINSVYWLASEAVEASGFYYIYMVDKDGSIDAKCDGFSLGIRPVVTLKSGVKTNGSKDTSFLGQTCWALK